MIHAFGFVYLISLISGLRADKVQPLEDFGG